MKSVVTPRLYIASLVIAAVAASPVLATPPLNTYTTVNINSPTALYNNPTNIPYNIMDPTSADAQASFASTQSLAYSHYDGPPATYTIIPTTDNTFASASLATGQLKVHANIGLGTASSGAPFTPGINNTGASAYAGFADSFTAYSGNTPYLWTTGTQATLHFAINGTTTIPNGFTSTNSHQYADTLLQAYVYKPGTLDLINQANNFDFNQPNANALYQALYAQVTANTITTASWFLGTPVAYFNNGSIPIIDPSTNPTIDFNFNPNGDFQFLLTENATIHLDASNQNTSVDLDFSHTIDTTYTGPNGSTTYSASGLFPNTLPDAQAPVAPEPASVAILLVGSAALFRRRRR